MHCSRYIPFLVLAVAPVAFDSCLRPITSDSIRDTLNPNRTSIFYENDDSSGAYRPFDKASAGFTLSFPFAVFDRSTHINALYQRWIGSVQVSLSKGDSSRFVVKGCSVEIAADSGTQRVKRILYVVNKGGSLFPRKFPGMVDSSMFAAITSSPGDDEQYVEYGSINDIPIDILTSDKYGHFTMYFVYYDFPEKADEISYRLIFEASKGDRRIQIDKNFRLHKTFFKSKTQFD